MKLVKEAIGFKRGQDPYDKLDIGVGTIQEFFAWAIDYYGEKEEDLATVDIALSKIPRKFLVVVYKYSENGQEFDTKYGTTWVDIDEGYDDDDVTIIIYTDQWEEEWNEWNEDN